MIVEHFKMQSYLNCVILMWYSNSFVLECNHIYKGFVSMNYCYVFCHIFQWWDMNITSHFFVASNWIYVLFFVMVSTFSSIRVIQSETWQLWHSISCLFIYRELCLFFNIDTNIFKWITACKLFMFLY